MAYKQIAWIHGSSGEYSAKQSIENKPLTAGELRQILEEQFEDDAPVMFYQGGYGVKCYAIKRIEEDYLEDEEDEDNYEPYPEEQ